MKFLVFGGTGFVGRNLAAYIKAKGGKVFSVSKSGGEESLALDISQEQEFSKINFKPDVIINCASIIPAKGKTSKDPAFLKGLFETNVIGGVNIANWAVKMQIPEIINCSTLVVVKKPWPNPLLEEYFELPEGFHVAYAMSKLSQEQLMDHCMEGSETNLLHLRLSAVYGTEMAPEGIIFKILGNARQNQDIILTDAKKNTIDLINVQDISKAVFEIARNGAEVGNRTMNLASGNAVSIYKLAEMIRDLCGSKSEIKNMETERPSSKSNINVGLLKKSIGTVFNDFTPLEAGLKAIMDRNKREVQ